jgi:hypothetical protein
MHSDEDEEKPPPAILPCRHQPLSSHLNIALNFFVGGGGEGNGDVCGSC